LALGDPLDDRGGVHEGESMSFEEAAAELARLFSGPRQQRYRQSLADAGYVVGKNLAIEFRWANFQNSVLPRLAADLVERRVSAIVTMGSPYAAAVAKAATSTIPIIFQVTQDPVKYGLVASFNRPGGNVTGVNFLSSEVTGKRLNLLLEVIPQATTVGYLSGPSESPVFEEFKNDMLAAGRALKREIVVLEVRRFDLKAAFATLVEQQVEALISRHILVFL
jgi:putative ABC transport system substrate-binding protein